MLFSGVVIAVSCPCRCLNSTKSPYIRSNVFCEGIYGLSEGKLPGDYSTESFALLASQLERLISIALFCQDHVILSDKRFSCDFLRFCLHCFHFVYISRCVTHGVRRAPVKISLPASVLVCRAETSVLVNEVTVLWCSINGLTCNIPGSIFGG